jgi:predicted RND superfamily exporter protein
MVEKDTQRNRPADEPRYVTALMDWRRSIIALVLVTTAFFALQLPGLKMYSEFSDLLPQNHPYIQLHNEIRDVFGGANVVLLCLAVEQGDIFTTEVLDTLHRITQDVDLLPGVDHNQLASLTHQKIRKIWITETGTVLSEPFYNPLKPPQSEEALAALRQDVVASPQVYGRLVAPNLQAALVTAHFHEGRLDYPQIFAGLQKIRTTYTRPGLRLYATGQPVLMGWVYYYVTELFFIFALTGVVIVGLLTYYLRRLFGVIAPLFCTALSACWGLGFCSLLGYNLDPLTLVIPVLISARAVSHAVQFIERFYEELERYGNAEQASRATMAEMFLPGLLGIATDATGLAFIAVGAFPLNTKLAYYTAFWASSIAVTVVVLLPLVLSYLPLPRDIQLRHNALRRILPPVARLCTHPRSAWGIVGVSAVLFVVGTYFSTGLVVGTARPGSPILYPDSDYNRSAEFINRQFPGSEELFVVAETPQPGGIKEPSVLRYLEQFQHSMMDDPEVGGTKSVVDLVKLVNQINHQDDPKWALIPEDAAFVGGVLFSYMASSPVPGALDEYVDAHERQANVVFYYKDHRGPTIARAIDRIKAFIAAHPNEAVTLRLAGGLIGVTAAMNEEIVASNVIIGALALVSVFVFVVWGYRSVTAALLVCTPLALATVWGEAFLALMGIGLNVNTAPVAAVGIGVGVDYAIYIMDRIKQEYTRLGSLPEAAAAAITTSGMAVVFTASTLIGGIIFWALLSSLRFQAEMSLLLSVLMLANMVSAMLLLPALTVLVRPAFIVRSRPQEDTMPYQTVQRARKA